MNNKNTDAEAFFIFQSDLKKYNLRHNLAPIVLRTLGWSNGNSYWAINLFHIKEFDTCTPYTLQDTIDKLIEINGGNFQKSRPTPYLSSDDIRTSRCNAQLLLKKSYMTSILKVAKDRSLNYIIHGTYTNQSNNSSTKQNHQNLEVCTTLSVIASRLEDTIIVKKSQYYNNSFYAYNQDNRLRIILYKKSFIPQTY